MGRRYIDQVQERYRREFALKCSMVQQLCVDAAFLAAADVFGMGPGRCEAFGRAMQGYVEQWAGMVLEDARDDKEIVYAKGAWDRRLAQVCGKNFQPWEERYR